MAMQDSWRERIELGKDLLSLGNPKNLSFSGDGGGSPALWKTASSSLGENGSNGADLSVAVSSSDGAAPEKATSESSEQSRSILKEHDYIGMAEVSSSALEETPSQNESSQELNLKETDLCLGLGLGLMPSKKTDVTEDTQKTIAFTFSQQEGMPKTMVDANVISGYAFFESASGEQRSLQATWTNAPMKSITGEDVNVPKAPLPQQGGRDFQSPQVSLHAQEVGSSLLRVPNTFPGARIVAHPSTLKNGLKRGYSEAMSEITRFNMTTEARAMSSMAAKSGETELKALPKQPQTTFVPSWVPTKPTVTAHWHVGLEQATSHSFGASKAVNITDGAFKGSSDLAETGQDSATIEAPPPKDRVVGWPPIRSYRKNTLAKPVEMFVKVNMDGVTVGRKVDLNAHSSYDGLLSALEEMFQPANSAQGGLQAASGSSGNDSKHFRLLNGSDYVLTYEDKDGDWMLVGDVPWSMFTTTVRRLRITRAPEATGPGARVLEKVK